MSSLKARLLVSLTIVLVLFLGVTGFTLDRAFVNSARNALYNRLQAYAALLIASAEQGEDGITRLTHALPEARFFTSGSGLYARFVSNSAEHGWYSPSMAGVKILFRSGLESGNTSFERIKLDNGRDVFAYSIGVTWGVGQVGNPGYTFSVAEDATDIDTQINDFRGILWGWLGAVTVVLLALQGTVLHWSLTPLRRTADDLEAIKSGDKLSLSGVYPKELRGLTDNINALIRSNHERLQRYRHTLDNLAHSLKTPLALMRSTMESRTVDAETREVFDEQITRMTTIVDYQLRRAATSGGESISAPVIVSAIAGKILVALEKVYSVKGVRARLRGSRRAKLRMDESDLYEMLGNVLDNAFKWCRQQVSVSIDLEPSAELSILIEDDGPGIPEDMVEQVLQRGARADTSLPGQGIGLAAVSDIVNIYNGRIEVGRSEALSGAAIRLRLPQH